MPLPKDDKGLTKLCYNLSPSTAKETIWNLLLKGFTIRVKEVKDNQGVVTDYNVLAWRH